MPIQYFLDIVAIQLRYSPIIVDEVARLSAVPIGLNISITIVALNSSPTTHIRCRGACYSDFIERHSFFTVGRTMPPLVPFRLSA